MNNITLSYSAFIFLSESYQRCCCISHSRFYFDWINFIFRDEKIAKQAKKIIDLFTLSGLNRKKKAYIFAFITVVGIMAWAFITAGVITHNFNRSQLQTKEDQQEAQVSGLILTETKDTE